MLATNESVVNSPSELQLKSSDGVSSGNSRTVVGASIRYWESKLQSQTNSVPHPPDGGASKVGGFANPEPSLNTPAASGAMCQAVSTLKPNKQV